LEAKYVKLKVVQSGPGTISQVSKRSVSVSHTSFQKCAGRKKLSVDKHLYHRNESGALKVGV